MGKFVPVWILVLLSLGVMILIDLPISSRPLEVSINPVDEFILNPLREIFEIFLSPGFAR